jgi:SAM-dependent methyltransferase
MENNYYGPVQDVLAEDPTRTKRVGMSLSHLCIATAVDDEVCSVDFGCGSGRWCEVLHGKKLMVLLTCMLGCARWQRSFHMCSSRESTSVAFFYCSLIPHSDMMMQYLRGKSTITRSRLSTLTSWSATSGSPSSSRTTRSTSCTSGRCEPQFVLGVTVVFRQLIVAQVTDYKALANEAARILRPGGLLLSGEWGRYTVMDNVRIEPNKYAPAYMLYTELVARAFEKNGPHMTAEAIVPLLRETGLFSISNDDYLTYPVRLLALYVYDILTRRALVAVSHGRGTVQPP